MYKSVVSGVGDVKAILVVISVQIGTPSNRVNGYIKTTIVSL